MWRLNLGQIKFAGLHATLTQNPSYVLDQEALQGRVGCNAYGLQDLLPDLCLVLII